MDDVEILHKLVGGKSNVTFLVGQLVAADSSGFTVDAGGGRFPARCATDYLPAINESVWVSFVDGTPYVVGPSAPVATQGTVVSVGSSLVTVTTQFGVSLTVPYNAAITPVAGQILHLSGKYADSVMSTQPVAPTPPPAPATSTGTHVDKFTALDAGSYNGSWSSSQLWASNTYLAAAWYGTKIRDTIPSTAVVSLVEVYISPVQIQGNAPNFALHPDLSRPAGSPNLSSPTAVPIAPGWVTLPNPFGDALKNGGGMAGIGLDHGGYNILASLAEDGDSAALRITSTY